MEKLGVIGCGTMGHSIALTAAWAGLPVTLHGLNDAETGKAVVMITDKLQLLAANGLLNHSMIEPIVSRIRITHVLEDIAASSSFIIENVPELLDLKRALFSELDKICAEDVVLATNTSGLSPSAIAAGTSHPERIIATHFWNPAHLIPLVEVIRGENTSDDTVNRSFDLLKKMHKKPIEVKKEVPGFVGNRLQFALLREALHILEEGIASREDIDAAVTFGIGRRLAVTGPLLSADMGGLDVYLAITNYLNNDLGNSQNASATLKKLVANDLLGMKSGEGFYKWDPSFVEEMRIKREQELIHYLRQDAER